MNHWCGFWYCSDVRRFWGGGAGRGVGEGREFGARYEMNAESFGFVGAVDVAGAGALRRCEARKGLSGRRGGTALVRITARRSELPFGLDKDELQLIAQEHFLVEEGGDKPELRPEQPLKLNVDLKSYRARCALRQGKEELARELYIKCLKTRPYDGRGWMGLAKMEMRAGRIAEARKLFSTSVQFCKKSPHLLQAWGVLEERAGNYVLAKKLYMRSCDADPTHAAAWVALGLFYERRANDIDNARRCYRTGTTADPSNYYLWHVWGELEASLGNIDDARSLFETGIRENPENSATYHSLGLLEYRLGNNSRAEELFAFSLKANPNNTHVFASYAASSLRAGDIVKARGILVRALKKKRGDPVIYQMLGLISSLENDTTEAKEWFERGIEVDAKHCPLWQAWGLMEARRGNMEKARELFQEGVWANPKSRFVDRIWHAWGSCEKRWGEIERARAYFRYGLEANPHSVRIYCAWGRLEAEEGKLVMSRKLFEEAISRDPSNSRVWRLFEIAENKYGDATRASTIFRRSVQAANLSDRRLVLSEAQSGDFLSTGSWTTESELRGDLEKQEKQSRLEESFPGSEVERSLLRKKPDRPNVSRAQNQSDDGSDEVTYEDSRDVDVNFGGLRARLDLGFD